MRGCPCAALHRGSGMDRYEEAVALILKLAQAARCRRSTTRCEPARSQLPGLKDRVAKPNTRAEPPCEFRGARLHVLCEAAAGLHVPCAQRIAHTRADEPPLADVAVQHVHVDILEAHQAFCSAGARPSGRVRMACCRPRRCCVAAGLHPVQPRVYRIQELLQVSSLFVESLALRCGGTGRLRRALGADGDPLETSRLTACAVVNHLKSVRFAARVDPLVAVCEGSRPTHAARNELEQCRPVWPEQPRDLAHERCKPDSWGR
eukprot:scaffold11884_cov107-Phaeocystis_antarctica.AAC.3